MRAGADPAIGKGEPVVRGGSPAPRTVIKRRVIVTRIVEHRPRRAPSRRRAAPRRAPAPARPLRLPAAPAAPLPLPPPRRRARPADHALVMTDISFDCMGTTVRLIVSDEATALACREFLEDFERT